MRLTIEDKTMNGFENMNTYGKDMVDGALKSMATATKGFQTIASESAEYAKASYEKGAAAMETVMSAKSVDKAVEAQMSFAKDSYEGMVSQMTKMGEMYTNMAKDAYQPFEMMAAKAK
jgi:phasin family protein